MSLFNRKAPEPEPKAPPFDLNAWLAQVDPTACATGHGWAQFLGGESLTCERCGHLVQWMIETPCEQCRMEIRVRALEADR